MITDAYSYIYFKKSTRFIFTSEGAKGKIVKIIQFSYLENNEWNLGFGDAHQGKIDDLILSNNQDIVRVMNTVAKAIYDFFQIYPDSTILIRPIDEKRKRFYNSIFQRHFKEIIFHFQIIGISKEIEEQYSPHKLYDNFKIMRKFGE
jgi:hypothetical protein